MIQEFEGKKPKIHKTVFTAKSANIIGDVEIGEESSIWFNAVIRGDEAPIRIGKNVSIQDGSIIHVHPGKTTVIKDNVTIGHNVTVHGCKINQDCIIGIGATILNNAEIGKESIIGAGAVVKEGDKMPPRSLAVGVPAKVVKELTDDDIKRIKENAQEYVDLKNQYLKQRESKNRI